MRGHLQQRSRDTWRLKVYVGRSADGKRRYLERTVRGARREAERELARLVVEVDEGRHVASAPMSIGELLDRWLEIKATTVEANTARGYEWIAEHYVRPTFGDRKVASIRTLELDHWYQQLRAGGGAGDRPLAGRTVRLCHTVMRQSLEQARKWGLVARNPAVDATPPAARRTEIQPPTIQQVHDLLEAAFEFDPDFGVYLWLLAVTGCRRGEACALRWSDVHWDRGEIAIRRSIAMVDHRRIEKDTKTHQARRVAVDDATCELLQEFHLRARERALSVGVGLADDAFLFSEEPDGSAPWRPDVCTNWFGRLRAELGLNDVRLHDVRHFVATALGDAGTPIATISARLGHRDKATTLNIYSHSLPAADAEAGAVMGALLRTVSDGRRRATSVEGS
ncbi:MAG TPA: site-specific integrase [Acidimicrobiales bacterium]|nr:site-specific integrase [Acidimicrobiales bacterium]